MSRRILSNSMPPLLRPRILLIEDNPERIALFRKWLEASPFVLIEATSGGQAMGVVSRGAEGIAGICLDHDLNSNPKTALDAHTSGSNVVTAICNKVPRTVPILVHSMNTVYGHEMHKRLEGAGFITTRVRMAALDQDRFLQWLGEVEENWEGLTG